MHVYWYWPFVRSEELGLGAALVERGHHVTLHTIAERIEAGVPDGVMLRDDIPGAPARRERSLPWLASRALVYPRRARARAATVAALRPDVAHIVYLNYFTDGFALRRLAQLAPVVSTVHDVVPHQGRVPRAMERRLLARQYAAAGTIIVHHPSVATRLTAEFEVDPERIHHVAWAVPEYEIVPRPAEPEPFVVLLFGTLRRNKGIDVLIDAFRRLDRKEVRLVVAGRGFADVEHAVQAAAAADTRIVAEIGRVSDARKQELYRAADLVVLPYTSFASQSAVLHDAYAHGRPVVVSDVGALGDAVRADGTGWVVRPGDAEALAAAIEQAAADPHGRRQAGAAAAATAHARRPAAVAGALERVYAHASGRRATH